MFNWSILSLNINGYWKKRDYEEDLNINHAVSKSYFINNLKSKCKVNKHAYFTFEMLNIFDINYIARTKLLKNITFAFHVLGYLKNYLNFIFLHYCYQLPPSSCPSTS